MTRSLTVLLALVTAALVLTACSDNRPAVCTSVDALQQSINNLAKTNISENGVAALDTNLTQVKNDLAQVKSDAKTQFTPQVDGVRTALDQLSSSVATAKADPTASSLSGVATAISSVGTALRSLQSALSGTC